MAATGKKYSNYSGWLIKIGNYTIPTNKFIKFDTYKAYAAMQDLDPWTDANGYLHRQAVELKTLKVEFETPAMLTDDELAEFLYNIDKNLIDSTGNECDITAFVPRYNIYMQQRGYLADITPQIYSSHGGILKYDAMRFAFVGGVYSG